MDFLKIDKNINEYSQNEQIEIFQKCIHWILENIRSGKTRFITADSVQPLDPELYPRHDFAHELFFQLSGACDFKCSNSLTYQLVPRDILLIPRGTPHQERPYNYNGEKFFNMVINCNGINTSVHLAQRDLITKRALGFWFKQNMLLMPTFYYNLLTTLKHHCTTESTNALLFSLLYQLDHDLQQKESARKYNPLVTQTLNLFKFSGYDPLDGVQEIAQKLQCSPNYLSAVFHRDYGRKLTDVLVEKRLDRAYEMLSSGKFNVAETAFQSGFRDSSYFARLFRQRFGIFPKQCKRSDF